MYTSFDWFISIECKTYHVYYNRERIIKVSRM